MKMSDAQFARLRHDMTAVLAAHDIRAERVSTIRDAWDVFAVAKGYWLYAEGLNDAHIETALRRMFSIKR
jgi:hypothetical protein